MGIPQRKPTQDMGLFKQRREKLARLCPGSAFVIPARVELLRNGSVHFPFRQDSNFYYLTGFDEPDAVVIIRPGQTPGYVLFVRPKDPLSEVWNGFRYGPEAAAKEFGADQAYAVEDFEKEAPQLLKSVDTVYYPLRWNRDFDDKMGRILEKTKASLGRTGLPLLSLADPNGPLGKLRSIKTEEELESLRQAARISAEAHIEVMKACRPGVNERALHGVFLGEIMKRGAAREGYGSIMATGANATALHYTNNDQELKSGDLFLIDAGGEYDYYTADITRTYPVSGKFTGAQKHFYQNVLDVQKSIVDRVRPGVAYSELQAQALEKLTDAMIDLKLIRTSRAEAIASGEARKYYPHGVSHFLGMDVHDVGLYVVDGESRKLEEGMVLTIEPGLYVPYDDLSAPAELRGFGVRIEDDVVVRSGAPEVLTALVPKEIKDLEEVVGNG